MADLEMEKVTYSIKQFSESAKLAQEHANAIITLISSGIVPAKTQMQEFNSDIAIMQEHYDTILKTAKAYLNESEMPADTSADALFAAIELKRKNLENKLQSLGNLLQRFISVKSYVDTYAQALEPYQKEAKSLLCDIDKGVLEAISESPVLEKSRIFIDAMSKDFDEDDDIEVYESLGKYFPPKVQLGIAKKKYYIDEQEHTVPLYSESENSSDETDIITDVSTEKNAESTQALTPYQIEETIEEKSENTLQSLNSVKIGIPSAKAFDKLLGKIPPVSRLLFTMLSFLGTFTATQALEFADCVEKSPEKVDWVSKQLRNTLQTLCDKGLLSSFNVNGEIAYCVTSFTSGCLSKKTVVSKYLRQSLTFTPQFIIDASIKESDIQNRLGYNSLLLRYLKDMKRNLSEQDYNEKISSDMRRNAKYYGVNVLYDSKLYNCLLSDNQPIENESQNLLVIEGDISPDIVEKFENVFLYTDGKMSRLSGKDCTTDDKETETAPDIVPDREEASDSNNIATQPTVKEDTKATDDKSVQLITEEKVAQKSAPEKEENISASSSPKALTEHSDERPSIQDLIKGNTTPDDNTICDLVEAVVSGKIEPNGGVRNVMGAVLLAKAASFGQVGTKCSRLSDRLVLATHYPDDNCRYNSGIISEALSDCQDEYLKMAIYLQALITPELAYDKGLYHMIKRSFDDFDLQFPSLGDCKQLYNYCLQIHGLMEKGFSPSIMSRLGDAKEEKKYVETLQDKALKAMSLPNLTTPIKSLPELNKKLFDSRSNLYACMEIIHDNNTDCLAIVKDELKRYCKYTQKDEYDEFEISREMIKQYINNEWDNFNRNFTLEYKAKDKMLNEFESRLTVMKEWIEHTNSSQNYSLDVNRINNLRKDITLSANNVISRITGPAVDYSEVLKYALSYIREYLGDLGKVSLGFDDFRYTGLFSLDEKGLPILDASTADIKYYEPWRRALKHIVSPIRTSEQARKAIVDYDLKSEIFDNLHQLSLLGSSNGKEFIQVHDEQITSAKEYAETCAKKFKEDLEMAFTYNRISEQEKERFAAIIDNHKAQFYDNKDFGCWRQFIAALEQEVSELAKKKKKALRSELEARKATLKEGETSKLLDEAERLLEDSMNFAVTEEYFSRFDNGERDFSEDLYAILHEEDAFGKFLSDETFGKLEAKCAEKGGKTVKNFAWRALEPELPRDWSSRQKDDSKRLLDNWPSGLGSTTPDMIRNLFNGLGFKVVSCERGTKQTTTRRHREYFTLAIEATAKSKADYRHPISLFGTQMKSPLNVVVLYGNHTPEQVVREITEKDLGMSVVLLDGILNRAARRQVCEQFHTKTTGQNPFLLIDRILILHLATCTDAERLPTMLKCTLPYTAYQPFVRDGGATADEMFCGRVKELAAILNHNGASIVYGGRQLGKTALLRRAESRYSNPKEKRYAVYCNIIDCDSEGSFIKKVTHEISNKTNLSIKKVSKIEDLSNWIKTKLKYGDVQSMLLLLDESDKFLSAIADAKYKALQPLIELKSNFSNQFKFVLAGLHNVCRARNATRQNGVFGQLGAPLCVKPLSPTDALQLLSRPLKYLGFKIDLYPHLETILTNTNYYPGILQFFGYNLIETVTNQYTKYYSDLDGNPPFSLHDEQLGAVMSDADLNRSIRDKFRLSLDLDPRYFMIARCITWLHYYHEGEPVNRLGFSVEEIMETATLYDIHCLENCDRRNYENLLDEMVEMGILSRPSARVYCLRRNSFINIIGPDPDTVADDIAQNNTENQ